MYGGSNATQQVEIIYSRRFEAPSDYSTGIIQDWVNPWQHGQICSKTGDAYSATEKHRAEGCSADCTGICAPS